MVKVTLKKSTNGEIQSVKDTVAALGLRKIGQCKTLEETPANLGQINKVKHLVAVEKA